jgi:uncharacterized protein (TIGR00251 family)
VAPIEQTAEGVRLRVKAVPRASRSEVAGIYGDAVRVRLAAPPVDGAANEELIRFLADALSLPRTAIRLVSGQTSRSKVITIVGVALEQVRVRLGL